jgi:hypothetical protein
LLRHRERYSKRNWSKIQKLPPFPIIKHSPHKRPTFDKKRHLEYFDKTKALTLLFQNSQVVAEEYFDKTKALTLLFQNSQVVVDPFLALALNFSPFGIGPKRDHCWPFNLIASPKSSIKSNKAIRAWRWTWSKIPFHRSAVEVFHGPSPPFPFNPLLRLEQVNSNTRLVSKCQVVTCLPFNKCITCTWTCEVRGSCVQLEHHK